MIALHSDSSGSSQTVWETLSYGLQLLKTIINITMINTTITTINLIKTPLLQQTLMPDSCTIYVSIAIGRDTQLHYVTVCLFL